MPDSYQVKIRMYRQGLGDCFLVTLPRGEETPFRMLIDCGVILGTEDSPALMTKVVNDIAITCGREMNNQGKVIKKGKIDVLVASHEHWDHLSGFLQAKEAFETIEIEEVWMPWTEDPDDKVAVSLQKQRHAMIAALHATEARLRVAGSQLGANGGRASTLTAELAGLLSFFGTSGRSTADALDAARSLGAWILYCSPEHAAITFEGVPARFYILGPPRDVKLLKKHAPSKRQPETYEFAAMDSYLGFVRPVLDTDGPEAAFNASYQIPIPAAKELGYFKERYWGRNDDNEGSPDQSWRRVDADWLESGAHLALKLDSATNNTSLAFAIELTESREVLLFAADAQVGNWLSWQDLVWEEDARIVTGPDLLSQAVFYKVGHHGSHNATLREKGLEQMTNLRVAMLPVDQQMAKQKNWNKMPLDGLLHELIALTDDCVIRPDKRIPKNALSFVVRNDELCYEIVL